MNEYFGNDLYFELISLNYKDKYVINELENLLFSKIPFGIFEEIIIREFLKEEADKIELHSLEKMYLPPKKSFINRIIEKVKNIK
ncbi:hypothetical protein [Clostridium sp. BL-8]|uniref:hypothetical protein n=1 Tax=Clostridium sp. BL-8 TaxID=349938 RepID=UPI001177A4BF|nr:hypothetical protein [Clostridium sp. BL-8]